jgi:hypothetical protein
LTVDPLGNTWVADRHNNRIEEFARVPEPSTIILLASGAASLLAFVRRFRQEVCEIGPVGIEPTTKGL